MIYQNSKQTTVAHIMVGHLAKKGILVLFPIEITGDMHKEHRWAMSTEGADLMHRYPDEFHEVCELVDDAIEIGEIAFLDDGTIIGWDRLGTYHVSDQEFMSW